MKTSGFSESLVPLVLSGKKTTTWRLWDDKDLSEGDTVTFVSGPVRKPFATAKIVSVVIKKFGERSPEDYDGHERYNDYYKTYSQYYGKKVTQDTPLKVIKFKLIKKIEK